MVFFSAFYFQAEFWLSWNMDSIRLFSTEQYPGKKQTDSLYIYGMVPILFIIWLYNYCKQITRDIREWKKQGTQ